MLRLFSTRVQTVVVIVLFALSLGTLLFNQYSPWLDPEREPQIREQLRDASRRMAEAVPATVVERAAHSDEDVNPILQEVAARILADCPSVEGGFYIAEDDRFAGYAFPTNEHPSAPPHSRSEPPPLEAPYIRLQAQQSLQVEAGQQLVSTRDVEASRVMFLSEPVGARRPAPLATWVMFRLTGPKQLAGKARHYAASMSLALGGLSLSLVLTWNLRRTLRRQRQEQERLRDELRHSEHLAALGRLLAGVAHEIRNPLAGIRSTVQLWQRLPEQARTPESMDAVVGAVDRLNAIVGRLLYFSRADHAERRLVDLNKLVNESLDLLAAQAGGQGITVERDLAANLPPVMASTNALREAILNLFTNAFQAMPQGGRLRCGTRFRPEASLIEFRVADTGPGVAEKVRPHLFEPFVTTRPDGTGLGLALCREIIQGHGGRIEVEASGPSGTTFLVILPVQLATETPP